MIFAINLLENRLICVIEYLQLVKVMPMFGFRRINQVLDDPLPCENFLRFPSPAVKPVVTPSTGMLWFASGCMSVFLKAKGHDG